MILPSIFVYMPAIFICVPAALFTCPPFCLRARHVISPSMPHSVCMPATLFVCLPRHFSLLALHSVCVPTALFTCPPSCLCARHVIFHAPFCLCTSFFPPWHPFCLRARRFVYMPSILSVCPPRHLSLILSILTEQATFPPFRSARHFIDPACLHAQIPAGTRHLTADLV